MKRILGIDPGYDRLGVCVLEKISNTEYKILYSVCLESNRKEEISERIFKFGKELKKIILKYKPTELAIEKLFFTTNQKTVMGVSEARGAIIYLSQDLGLKIYEYTPLQIKIAVTGYGKADKNQVYFMLQKILKLKDSQAKKLDDEYDAIAVAYTHSVSVK
ncbi:Crossover junction endodeoxyribonuclease RuvC [bioreactor metagenome]|uniref:Crossover junction endodeoxyribonuclease RuvC n=1 Tax=bioreactor metagenome TaxID=1076179 RepID=A0A644UA64_9ZZZZ|nr:crossover junction endodeoxyribonuclease RuvC [Candidatus Elulimicrobiales bacterium]